MRSPEENAGTFIDAWKLLAGRFPNPLVVQDGGLATMFARIPLPFLNMSILDRPLRGEADLRGVLAVAEERAKDCEHVSLLAVCESWVPEGWEKVVAEAGLAPMMSLTGMATDRLLPPRRALPQLEFRRVSDVSTARDIAMLNAQAYAMPPEMFECMCNLHVWHADSFGSVGYVQGRAVTAAAAFPVAGTVYLALVATLPEAHGKGYAEAVMRQVIEQGSRAMGTSRLTLHATDAGRPLYEAMGFEPGGRVALLGPAEAASGH